MNPSQLEARPTLSGPRAPHETDLDLVRRALARDASAFATIMARYNRRLYRIARGILRNDSEAEDVVQDTYLRAFTHLDGFRGESALSTWLSRIAMNEALGRLRREARRPAQPAAAPQQEADIIPFPLNAPDDDPERSVARREIIRLIEQATDALPDIYRLVFVARVVEDMSVEETARLLGLKPETVKTRLHRARQLVRGQIDRQIGPVLLDAFPFAGPRCEALTEIVLGRLNLRKSGPGTFPAG